MQVPATLHNTACKRNHPGADGLRPTVGENIHSFGCINGDTAQTVNMMAA